MNTMRNRQLEKYQKYLNKAVSGQLKDISPAESIAKLVSLYLALRRKEAGLHLRWNRLDSLRLGITTVEDVLAQNPKSEASKHLKEAIRKLSEGDTEEALKSMLHGYEIQEKEESEKQRIRAKTPRPPTPIAKRIESYITTNREITNNSILNKLDNEFECDDEFYQYTNPLNQSQTKSLSKKSVPNLATKIRKKLSSQRK